MESAFAAFAQRSADLFGSAWAFLISAVAFVAWLVLGQIIGWTESVHLWPTSLLTWLTWIVVVLIQHSQNRHEIVLQKKLDELIRAIDKADNRLIGLEKQPPSALDR